VLGYLATLIPEWSELVIGVPVVLTVYCLVIWYRGFGPEDRLLFKLGAEKGA
jgi:hypothetical protein